MAAVVLQWRISWVITHRDYGAIRTFLDRDDAEAELDRVFGDEPTWAGTLWIEPFEFVVPEATNAA